MADFYYFMAAYLTIGRQVFHVHSILCFISFNCHCSSVLENRKIRNRSEIVIMNSLSVFATDMAF